MTKIFLDVRSEGIGIQLFDAWVAYRQNLNQDYRSDIDFVTDAENADLRILFDYRFQNTTHADLDQYDILLACNGGEPIAVGSPHVKTLLQHDHCKMICNSYHGSPEINKMLIWYPDDIIKCRDWWLRSFYPQFYRHSAWHKSSRSSSIIFINGQNRAWRAYFLKLLVQACPAITVKNNLDSTVTKIQDSQWESIQDIEFREFCNEYFGCIPDYSENFDYYENSISIGRDNRFGLIPPGYFLLPSYYENSAVIFPESSWQNQDLCITEKSMKCFLAGSMPFPIGGSHINQLYNEVGFFTCYNLLPNKLREFDNELDHRQRYNKIMPAIRWLIANPWIFKSKTYREYVDSNYKSLIHQPSISKAIHQFDILISKFISKAKERHSAQTHD